jgi:hypothetical protein
MTFLDAIQNHRGGNSAIAVEAFAGSLSGGSFLAGKGEFIVDAPTKASAGSPALLTIGGRNPNSSASSIVMDCESPFSTDATNVPVMNDVCGEGINDYYVGVFENEFWSHPQSNNAKPKNRTNSNVNNWVAGTLVVENGLSDVKSIKEERGRTPNQVALGFENDFIIHSNILAGKTIAKKENA